MSYIKLDKSQLSNLEYTLNKELLRTSRSGAYSCTTLVFCNTRKYHGLLVVPQPQIDYDRHVLLSSVDETVIQHQAEFNLAVHKYPGTFHPGGHKYIVDFETDPIPRHTYRVGGVLLQKEIIFTATNRILIKYTLLEARSHTILRIRPLLAFRNYHSLSKANMFVDTKYQPIQNGIQVCMYHHYTPIYMQFSKAVEYIHIPDWFYNVEYPREIARGYEGHEDLYSPGYFEFPIAKNESVFFTAGLEVVDPASLKKIFHQEVRSRTPRNSFENCLINSAQQFLAVHNGHPCIVAGYPWYQCRLRDTFISLPGMALAIKQKNFHHQILDPLVQQMEGPHFRVQHTENEIDYSADVSLWFIRALQLLIMLQIDTPQTIWKRYKNIIYRILKGYLNNESPSLQCTDERLIWVNYDFRGTSWMNARVNGDFVTPRWGYLVEVNALWYNAICFALELAKIVHDQKFLKDWESLKCVISQNFKNVFWSKEKGYLADFVHENGHDWTERPNMIVAVAVPYSPLSLKIQQIIVEHVRLKMLTPRGLRSLSPDDARYRSAYEGNEYDRAMAFHQGTVWPWLLGLYVDAYLKVYGKSGLHHIISLYKGFEETVLEHGIGSISEVYHGDPPHQPGGAISMAWSVCELLRVASVIKQESKGV